MAPKAKAPAKPAQKSTVNGVKGAKITKSQPAAKQSKAAAASKASTKTKPATKATASKPVPKAASKAAAKSKAAPAPKTKAAAAKGVQNKNQNGKRAMDEDGDAVHSSAEEAERRPQKKARRSATPQPQGPTGWRKEVLKKRFYDEVINNPVPTSVLDVFVFGEGSSGELGLGSKKTGGKKPIDVKRPRLNPNLGPDVGIVDIACGGMHAIALTKANRVLTWGVNDDKALGRDTTWAGGVRDADAEESDSDDDDDTGVNPRESTPAYIDNGELDPSDVICKVVACDSASFVLTTDGLVFGWGTFRGADGIIGFSNDIKVQPTPMLIEPLRDITNITCGSNHVIALDAWGKAWTWGSGGQFQLGRKPLTRHGNTLVPQPCGLFTKRHRAVDIAAGSYHSFYVDNQQRVWSWGLNNYSQTGHHDATGEDDAMILRPKVVDSLTDADISMIDGGEHHSVATTNDGKLLTWGRVDGHQVGQPKDLYTEENAMFDENNKPRILLKPTRATEMDAKIVAAGVDTSFAIDSTGHVYSWGFSANYQTGQGTIEDIEVPTLIDNSAIRDRKIVWAGAGGQFSILAAERDPANNSTNSPEAKK
ncbi:RCC1/BLIP-II [Nemania sp. FL0916]|nr:RCC1/BLIP-II [Nemania sp. FL0916]